MKDFSFPPADKSSRICLIFGFIFAFVGSIGTVNAYISAKKLFIETSGSYYMLSHELDRSPSDEAHFQDLEAIRKLTLKKRDTFIFSFAAVTGIGLFLIWHSLKIQSANLQLSERRNDLQYSDNDEYSGSKILLFFPLASFTTFAIFFMTIGLSSIAFYFKSVILAIAITTLIIWSHTEGGFSKNGTRGLCWFGLIWFFAGISSCMSALSSIGNSSGGAEKFIVYGIIFGLTFPLSTLFIKVKKGDSLKSENTY